MDKLTKTAIRWMFHQPPLNEFYFKSTGVDFALASLVNWLPNRVEILFVIERRAVLYSRAGCKGLSAVKSAVRDFKQTVEL